MAGYIVFDINVKDMEKVKEYSAEAGKLVAKHGGEFLAKGMAECLSGEAAYKMSVLIQFPSVEQAKSFYTSDEYQGLLPIRNQAMDAVVKLIGE